MTSRIVIKRVIVTSLAAAATCVWLSLSGANPAVAADAGGGAAGTTNGQSALQARRARMQMMAQRMLQARLDEAAGRLQIRASQEPAWNAFATAVRGLAQPPAAAQARPQPNGGADAAALLQRRAAAAMARAQRLSRLADATTKLQAVLDPNQRQVLEQVVRSRLGRAGGFHRRGMMMRPMMRFRMGPRGPQRPGGS